MASMLHRCHLRKTRSSVLIPFVQRNVFGQMVTFSTSAESSTATNSRITKTLYRQLLRWCKTAPKIPLTTLVPPVHMESPENVDPFRLEVLSIASSFSMDDRIVSFVRNILPKQTEIKRTSMTVPIHQVDDVRNIVRAIFRLNMEQTSPPHQKRRLSATFTALRSLNELSSSLDSIEMQREVHRDRTNVNFHVGQVVQHEQERWRGVIASWSRSDGSATTSTITHRAVKSSLTTKDYSEQASSVVTYDVILDAGDAHAMGSSSGWSRAVQTDLKLVDDRALVRIHSSILKDYFTRFDVAKKCFVPNELVAYQFPSDVSLQELEKYEIRASDAKLCLEIISGVQRFASRLERCIHDETSCPKQRGLVILGQLEDRLAAISKGDVFSRKEKYTQQDLSPMVAVANHLHALVNLQLEIVAVNHKRRVSLKTKDQIKFGLGDVVRHKVYGFRGVVVAWDPKPAMDVRRWDGLQHIDNPMEKPFYHVVPDQSDCIKAFGGERPGRYVCEENLEGCPESDRNIVVDLDVGWEKMAATATTTTTAYQPPQVSKYQYGEDLKDDGVTERCMTRLQDEFNSLYMLAREVNPSDSIASLLSLQKLVDFLKIADSASNANAAQETIKEMRKAHARRDLRLRLDTGITQLLNGQGENAMETYRQILEEDPQYVEAWNKLASCQFMYGRNQDCLLSTQKALELDPDHLQAIIGLGLFHFENDEYEEAVKCLRRAMEIDPWSPAGAKLSLTLDLLDNIIQREELSDD